MITKRQILNWLGEDQGKEELVEYLAAILNGELDVRDAVKEISDYDED